MRLFLPDDGRQSTSDLIHFEFDYRRECTRRRSVLLFSEQQHYSYQSYYFFLHVNANS